MHRDGSTNLQPTVKPSACDVRIDGWFTSPACCDRSGGMYIRDAAAVAAADDDDDDGGDKSCVCKAADRARRMMLPTAC